MAERPTPRRGARPDGALAHGPKSTPDGALARPNAQRRVEALAPMERRVELKAESKEGKGIRKKGMAFNPRPSG